MGFIFNYGHALSFNGEIRKDNASLDGTSTKSTRLVLTENIKAVGIRFKPVGASVFIDAPLTELKDQRINIGELNSIHFTNLYDKISEQKDISDKVAIIEKVLHKTRR